MKKILPALLIAAIATILFAACNSKSQPDTNNNGKVLTYVDTTGLADFQKWKAVNERVDPSMYKQDTYSEPAAKASPAPVRKTASYRTIRKASTDQYPAKAAQKKGWSRKAKGSVIGGASGAILGAVINKNNRVKGGIVGGLLGAGLGYVIGNEMDRKHGR